VKNAHCVSLKLTAAADRWRLSLASIDVNVHIEGFSIKAAAFPQTTKATKPHQVSQSHMCPYIIDICVCECVCEEPVKSADSLSMR